MAFEELEQVIVDLTAWCNVEHGRQTELAKRLGVSKQLVSHWVNRRRTPSLHNFLKVRKFLQRQRDDEKIIDESPPFLSATAGGGRPISGLCKISSI